MQVNIALLTVTDTRTIDTDKSGAILIKKIKEQNHKLIDRKIVKDEKDKIKKILLDWIKKKRSRCHHYNGGNRTNRSRHNTRGYKRYS